LAPWTAPGAISPSPLRSTRYTHHHENQVLFLSDTRSKAQCLFQYVLQCGMGHLLCTSCRISSQECPSPLCASPITAFTRCLDMERVVEAIEAPCCFAKNGCTEKMVYFNKAKHGCTVRAMLLPRSRLRLHPASGGAAGPFRRPPQVAVHGVRVLRTVGPAPPAGPARPPRQGRQQRLPRERGAIASASGTPLTYHLSLPRARHLPRLRPAGDRHRLHEVQVRLVFDVLNSRTV
jgi:hypothetical protein